MKDFAVLSTGGKVENSKYLQNSLIRLKVLQKRISRIVKDSKNKDKAKLHLYKLYEKIRNQRNDFQHKILFRIINENQATALEILNVKGMQKNQCLVHVIGYSA